MTTPVTTYNRTLAPKIRLVGVQPARCAYALGDTWRLNFAALRRILDAIENHPERVTQGGGRDSRSPQIRDLWEEYDGLNWAGEVAG